jgi:hypothetical protein
MNTTMSVILGDTYLKVRSLSSRRPPCHAPLRSGENRHWIPSIMLLTLNLVYVDSVRFQSCG